jgi:hypothetical protein
MAKKKKQPKTWMLPSPTQKTAKAPLAEPIKADADAKATKLVESVLKPKYVQPPPENPQFNYVIDVWTKWIGGALYFGATYACPGPNAISPSFEVKFARMEHLGGGRFALSYMRHTEKWFKLFPSLTVDECLEAIENGWHFQLD